MGTAPPVQSSRNWGAGNIGNNVRFVQEKVGGVGKTKGYPGRDGDGKR